MNEGQIRERILNRSVYKHIKKKEAGVTFADTTSDVSLVRLSETESLATGSFMASDVNVAWTVAKNRVLTALPERITASLLVLVPSADPEADGKAGAMALRELSDRDGIPVTAVRTQVVAELDAPLFEVGFTAVTKQGKQMSPAPGTNLLMIGYTGHLGTKIAAELAEEDLTKRFGKEYYDRSVERLAKADMTDVAKALASDTFADTKIRIKDVSEGGVYSALYHFAEGADAGIRVRRSNLPILQETVEYAEFLGMNPYELLGSGAWIIAAEDADTFTERLRACGVNRPIAKVGTVTEEKAKMIEESTRSLSPSDGDQIYSLMRKRVQR